MEIKIISSPISIEEIKKMANEQFGDMIKAIVDVEREIIALGGELHVDGEALLLENSSKQNNIWGINIYPFVNGEDWIEFDSMVNIRPSQGNRSRGVDNSEIRDRIRKIVSKLVIM